VFLETEHFALLLETPPSGGFDPPKGISQSRDTTVLAPCLVKTSQVGQSNVADCKTVALCYTEKPTLCRTAVMPGLRLVRYYIH
jgi:hypothetical protein